MAVGVSAKMAGAGRPARMAGSPLVSGNCNCESVCVGLKLETLLLQQCNHSCKIDGVCTLYLVAHSTILST